MELVEIIKLVDGGVSVAVLLFVWYRTEVQHSAEYERLHELINRLADHD